MLLLLGRFLALQIKVFGIPVRVNLISREIHFVSIGGNHSRKLSEQLAGELSLNRSLKHPTSNPSSSQKVLEERHNNTSRYGTEEKKHNKSQNVFATTARLDSSQVDLNNNANHTKLDAEDTDPFSALSNDEEDIENVPAVTQPRVIKKEKQSQKDKKIQSNYLFIYC